MKLFDSPEEILAPAAIGLPIGATALGKSQVGEPINDVISLGASKKARDLYGKVGDAYNGLTPPELQEIQLEKLVQQGVYTPEEARAALMGDTAMSGISLDPRTQQAQMDALQSLQDISKGGGLTDMDRAKLAEIQSQEDTAARGQREAILQSMAQRGMGGSGIELLANLKNQQDSATRRSARDTDVAGMAQQRALEAIQQAGQLGGQMQNADFARQSQIAQAKDEINKFNTQNTNTFNLANVGARNEAQKGYLAEKQRIADANTSFANQAQQYNKGLAQQNFNNQATIAAGKSGAAQSQANAAAQEAAGNKQLFGSVIGAGATAMSDKKAKKDIGSFSASEFLDSLTPTKFRYKDAEKDGYGQHAGIIAQDLEKTPAGDAMVEDTPDGKRVDFGKGFNTLLASVTDIHERLKALEGR